MRLVFGVFILVGDMIYFDEVCEIIEVLIGGKKIKVWFEGVDCVVEKVVVKILMNLVIILVDIIF